jgi:RNA polymerase sigma-70 factor (ECF subfamily)
VSALESRADTAACAEQETARLFEAHSAEVLGYCRRHLPSGADAEDALQTTFLYALRALRRGVEPECETAWLTAIAKNVCFTQRRTLGRRGSVTADVELDRIALAEPEPDEIEFLAALPEALAALPENQRNALVMREWLGLGAGEIAERLELTPTATNALLTRARRSLARGLRPAVRPRSALNLGALLGLVRGQLRALLGATGSKAAVGAVIATVAVGGVVAERSLEPAAPHPEQPAATNTSPQVRATGPTRVTGTASREIPPAPTAAGPAHRPARRVAAPGTLAGTARPAATRDAPTSSPRTEPTSTSATPVAEEHEPTAPRRAAADKTVVPSLPALPPLPVAPAPALPAIEVPPLPALPELPALPAPEQPVDAPQAPPLASLP